MALMNPETLCKGGSQCLGMDKEFLGWQMTAQSETALRGAAQELCWYHRPFSYVLVTGRKAWRDHRRFKRFWTKSPATSLHSGPVLPHTAWATVQVLSPFSGTLITNRASSGRTLIFRGHLLSVKHTLGVGYLPGAYGLIRYERFTHRYALKKTEFLEQ